MVKVKHLVLGHPGHLPERLFSSIKTKYQKNYDRDAYYKQCRLNAWACWSVAWVPHEPMGPHANLCMLCTACFFMLNTDFVGSTKTINICLI